MTGQVVLMNTVDGDHLERVVREMGTMGPPRVRAFVRNGKIYLIEGTHRASAAARLGLTVLMDFVDYPEDDSIHCMDWLPELDAMCEVRDIIDHPGPTLTVTWEAS